MTNGAVCVVNPCDDALFTAGRVMCPDNWSCMPTGGGLGVCRRTAAQLFGPCNPGAGLAGGDVCPTGSYCRPYTAAGGLFPRPSGTRFATLNGMCITPTREGGICDSDFGAVGAAVGRQCEAGLTCDFMPGTATGNRRCQRPCTSDNDCPCSTSTTAISCRGVGSSQRLCNFCFADRSECAVGVASCCNSNATCQTIQLSGSSQPQCCVSNGGNCTSNSECCYGAVCGSTNKCQACVNANGAATAQSQCCAGLEFSGGLCQVPCNNPAGANARPLVGTACSVSPTNPQCNSIIECDPTYGYRCRPPTNSPPETPGVCNMVDESCEGRVDEGVRQACTVTPPGCQSALTVPGYKECGSSTCIPLIPFSTNVCRSDGSDIYGPGGCAQGYNPAGGCGGGVGSLPCSSHEICGPAAGFTCSGGIPGPGDSCSPSGGFLAGCGQTSAGCTVQCRADPAYSSTTNNQCWLLP